MKTQLLQIFEEKYGTGGEITSYFSPGRVNLIGEHTDYNGGHVFPCALTIGTYFLVRKRSDSKLRFYSENFKNTGIIENTLDTVSYREENGWTNYLLGILWALEQKGHPITHGMDLLICGNIPNSSGLSSSASIEVGMAFLLNEMFGFGLTPTELAVIGQYAENHFNQVECGIMDQFAIAMGKKDSAIFLDTASLKYEYVPIALNDMKIVIICSNKKRGLCDSKYNERRRECTAALSQIQEVVGIESFGDLTMEQFESYQSAIRDECWLRRARHAVTENLRTIKAVEVLQAGDIEAFGKLMNASHISLRDDYEVTGIELDTLVDAAWSQDGVIGARMTGAGFGGCTVNIVKDDCVDAFIENVGKIYREKIGYAADFYIAHIGDGTRQI